MSEVCDCCGDKGWLHMDQPFEIQGCDSCTKARDDNEAILLHRMDHPECQWPEHDLVDAFLRQLGYVAETGLSKQAALLLENIQEAASRDTLPRMAASLFSAIGCLVCTIDAPGNRSQAHPSDWRHLEHALSYLSQIYFMAVSSGLPINAEQSDGVLDDKGHWRLKEKPHAGDHPPR
jgi:murein L,D-transpeptidase YcbB/YkuD